VHCLTKNLPRRLAQLAVRNSWLDSLLTKLAGAMIHGSLPLAIAPQRFPVERLVFSAFLAAGCGFARADSDQGSGAATPGRCRRCSVRGWPPFRRRSAPILPQRGLCGCAASPARVFFAPARGTGSRVLQSDGGHSSLQEAFPYHTHPRKRRAW
jgi:hypothetical protein